jgi:hypothetical protein
MTDIDRAIGEAADGRDVFSGGYREAIMCNIYGSVPDIKMELNKMNRSI